MLQAVGPYWSVLAAEPFAEVLRNEAIALSCHSTMFSPVDLTATLSCARRTNRPAPAWRSRSEADHRNPT
jgi:hypothetical protein